VEECKIRKPRSNMKHITSFFTERNLSLTMYIVGTLWVIFQIIIVFLFWGAPQFSDPGLYMQLAEKCFQNGEWYPLVEDIYSNFMFAPAFVNFLILQLKIFGTMNFNAVLNIIMNIGIAMQIYYLGKKLFTVKTATIAVIFWCLLYNNTKAVWLNYSEIPFLFIVLGCFCLCMHQSFIRLFAAGILFAIANWIRPLVPIFLIPVLVYLFLNKCTWKHYITLFVPLLVTILIIGFAAQKKMGYFVYQSTTSVFNLIMVANDNATGGYVPVSIDSTSCGYIENSECYTFKERDSIRMARSINWIKQHPDKYAVSYIKRAYRLYRVGGIPWSDHDRWMYLRINQLDTIPSVAEIQSLFESGEISRMEYLSFTPKKDRGVEISIIENLYSLLNKIKKTFTYKLILFIFCLALIVRRKEWWSPKGVLLLFLLFFTAGSAIFPVESRYSYPMMFAIVLIAAYGVEYFIEKREKSPDDTHS